MTSFWRYWHCKRPLKHSGFSLFHCFYWFLKRWFSQNDTPLFNGFKRLFHPTTDTLFSVFLRGGNHKTWDFLSSGFPEKSVKKAVFTCFSLFFTSFSAFSGTLANSSLIPPRQQKGHFFTVFTVFHCFHSFLRFPNTLDLIGWIYGDGFHAYFTFFTVFTAFSLSEIKAPLASPDWTESTRSVRELADSRCKRHYWLHAFNAFHAFCYFPLWFLNDSGHGLQTDIVNVIENSLFLRLFTLFSVSGLREHDYSLENTELRLSGGAKIALGYGCVVNN